MGAAAIVPRHGATPGGCKHFTAVHRYVSMCCFDILRSDAVLSTEVAFSCESQQQVQLLAVITGAILQPGAAPIVVDNAITVLGLSTGFASGCSQRSGWFQANWFLTAVHSGVLCKQRISGATYCDMRCVRPVIPHLQCTCFGFRLTCLH